MPTSPRGVGPAVAGLTTAVAMAAACLTSLGSAQAQQAHGVPARPAPSAHACSPSAGINWFSDALDKTTFEGSFVGNFSALAVDAHGTVDALGDRSSLFTLDGRTLHPERVQALADEQGQPLDSEAIAVDRDGTRLISSEVEPGIRRYDRAGDLVGRLPVPAPLAVAPAGRATSNQTFEGMALQPGSGTLVASMEGALSGDHTDLVRFQTWHRTGGRDFAEGPQYAYHVDTDDHGTILGVSDLATTGDGRLLVLERGFTPDVGNTVRLYLADPSHATDVSDTAELTGQPEIRTVHKTLLADIGACPSLGATAKEAQPNPLLDNIEGMTVTGHAPGGRLHVLLVSDDNQSDMQTTRFYSLTVRLPGAGQR